MNKNKMPMIAVLLVVGLLLLGGIAYALMNKSQPASQQSYQDATKNSTQAQPSEPVRVSSIGNFYTDGSTRKCAYTVDANNFTFENTYYFDNNRAFTTIKSTENGKSSNFNQLYVDGVSYSWEQGSTNGTKVVQTVEELKKLADDSMANADESVQAENQKKVEDTVITCEPWTADASKFEVPAGVTFKEITI
ncbi:MAG: hypothetical protein ABIQ64_01970 [Candidatus Saccharimonadales bacterium]